MADCTLLFYFLLGLPFGAGRIFGSGNCVLTASDRFMAASKVLGEESVKEQSQ